MKARIERWQKQSYTLQRASGVHIEFSRDLRLRLPAVDDHFHRLTLELLLILLLYPFLFHGSLYSTLSFRVRQMGGVSRWLFFLGRWRGQQSLSRSQTQLGAKSSS